MLKGTTMRQSKQRTLAMAAVAAACVLVTLPALAGVEGVWKTEANEQGGYLEVTVAPCASDDSKICGKISKAYNKDGEDSSYPNLGKPIIENMSMDDETSFSGGTIWDPEKDKTYKSKMTLQGDELDVDGCVAIICDGQAWQRVK